MAQQKLDSISFADALEKALSGVTVTNKHEIMILSKAASGAILADDIVCVKNLPSFDNSAMDGFAVRASDAGKRIEIVAAIHAGDTLGACLKQAQCYRIMTRAQLPEDADSIVPVED